MPHRARNPDSAIGVAAIVAASVIWGLSTLYYKALAHVPPLELLSHRTLWSLVFFGAVLAFQGRLGEVRATVSGRGRLPVIALAALMIAINWLVFIWAIQVGRALEASLGYYIFPLVAVTLGFLVQRERLMPVQVLAIALAALGVLVLTFGLGVPPYVSLLLAFSFGLYGLLKARLVADPVVSVFAEVLLLAPAAFLWVAGIEAGTFHDPGGRPGGMFFSDPKTALMLMGSGPLTATPLILFTLAARKVSYATVGLVQYLNPTLQFLIATLVFGEIFTRWHAVAFALIWTALALYTAAALRRERRRGAG